LKILLICEAVFPENKGGIERWFQTLGGEFLRKGHEVTHYNASNINGLRGGIFYKSSSQTKWNYKDGGVRSKSQAIQFSINLFKWLRKERFDIIYCSSVPLFSIFGVFLAKKGDPKVFIEWFEIWTLRYWVRYSGIVAGPAGWFVQLFALQLGRHRVVYTERARMSVTKLGFTNRNKVECLPGLCSEVKPILAEKYRAKKNDIYFLGRFVNEKQPFLAINCVEAFAKQGWKGKFRIVGTGPVIQDLRKIIKMKNIDNFIEVVENPTDVEIEKIASDSFVLLHPSRREGYGLASVEAAYYGVPSLLIDYPDNATVDLEISPELVAQNDDIDSLVKLLTLAWENQEKFASQTIAWAKQARSTRSFPKTCNRILELAMDNPSR
jgi:glycosyltransferase involved in cell wall biosynthesis